MKKRFLLAALSYALINTLFAQKMEGNLSKADVPKIDFKAIAAKKEHLLKAKSPVLVASYDKLIKEANEILNVTPVSVMDKKAFPPSGNKHDYMSIGPYWWPDTSKPGRVPYMQKDGQINPEVHDYPDKENMPTLCENVYKLGIAYYYSNDEVYAKKATELVKVWFLDTATKMNPNLNYAQAVKGRFEGRPEGLIDTRHFIYMLDGIQLLKNSKSWTPQKDAQLKKWFSQFLVWLNTSKNGNGEMNAKNNHGVWFDAQSLAIAVYVDSISLANKIIARAEHRLESQMNDDGFFPLELARTTSLHYSAFIMNAFNIIAIVSDKTSTNFWTAETASGKSYKKALDALVPYLSKDKEWTWKEIRPFNFQDAYPLLLRDANRYNCPSCLDAIKKLAGEKYQESIINLL
jgi:hypothetical protein